MGELTRKVATSIARFDEVAGRIDRSAAAREAEGRVRARRSAGIGERAGLIGLALAVLAAATIGFSFVVGPIGLGGLFVVGTLMFLAVLVLGLWDGERPAAEYREDMPNQAVVARLDGLLVAKRPALPAPAAQRVDAISRQLPLLEQRLAEADMLDPLAQDARRLMGKHLPELIESYERVPAPYRRERDPDGLTVDERLVAGLDAASAALDDLGRKLAHEDLNAFRTQGRFIESRYRDDQDLRGS